MKMDKVIVRTVVNTLCAIAVMAAASILFASFIFPSTMMDISYKLGNDSGAMKYAQTSYTRTKKVFYIAFATEVACGVDDLEGIALYGEQFIADEEFDKYCSQTEAESNAASGSYRQYVYGRLAVAEYSLGEKDRALELATEAIGTAFPRNNAMVALFFEAMLAGDVQTVQAVEGKMRALQDTIEGTDATYLSSILEAYDKSGK